MYQVDANCCRRPCLVLSSTYIILASYYVFIIIPIGPVHNILSYNTNGEFDAVPLHVIHETDQGSIGYGPECSLNVEDRHPINLYALHLRVTMHSRNPEISVGPRQKSLT